MIQVKSFVFNPFMENTYVLYDDTGECIIIDPGCYEEYEEETLDEFIRANDLKVKYLINTHGHIDHVLGNDHIIQKYKVPFLMHETDLAILRAVKTYAPNYGFHHYRAAEPTGFLKEGDQVMFGNVTLDVLFLPGHAPGHIGLYDKDQKVLISGDVLFRESVGRTDLPGGDHETLINSIQDKIFPLPDEVIVYCGHGPETSIGHEKQYNPFCATAE
jgi:glyoxylase-like metal-dependent hydrolase (beta-lactamase superfamily II)